MAAMKLSSVNITVDGTQRKRVRSLEPVKHSLSQPAASSKDVKRISHARHVPIHQRSSNTVVSSSLVARLTRFMGCAKQAAPQAESMLSAPIIFGRSRRRSWKAVCTFFEQSGTPTSLEAGQTLVVAHARSDSLYLLVDGTLETTDNSMVLESHSSGEVIGFEQFLLGKVPRFSVRASVNASAGVRLITLSVSRAIELITDRPLLAVREPRIIRTPRQQHTQQCNAIRHHGTHTPQVQQAAPAKLSSRTSHPMSASTRLHGGRPTA